MIPGEEWGYRHRARLSVRRVEKKGGVMVGFLSHLLLDELYSVDIRGVKVKLNKYAGTAVKLASPSFPATALDRK